MNILVDDRDEDLLDELLAPCLSVLLSFMDITLVCFSGEDSSFASLTDCVAQIPVVEGGACFSGNLCPLDENLSFQS